MVRAFAKADINVELQPPASLAQFTKITVFTSIVAFCYMFRNVSYNMVRLIYWIILKSDHRTETVPYDTMCHMVQKIQGFLFLFF